MKIKFDLPALTEAVSPFWRPIKYSLFPPLGVATSHGVLSKVTKQSEVNEIEVHIKRSALAPVSVGSQENLP